MGDPFELAGERRGDPEIQLGRARRMFEAGEHRAAIRILQKVLHSDPGHVGAAVALADVWTALGEVERARLHLQAALRLDPHDAIGAGRRLAALAQAVPSERHPAAFVRHLFDGFAPTYDADMIGRLGYCAPDILMSALGLDPDDPAPAFDVLDLGCGTGLAGALIRPFARRLDGIDLSPAMLARARARGAYDRLVEADLVEHLAATPERYDLVLAADVLIYLGDLRPVLAGVRRVLRPGGMLAFTLEAAAGIAYELGPKRRFRHGEAYLRDVTGLTGFDLPLLAPAVPRHERGEPVAGWVAVAVAREP